MNDGEMPSAPAILLKPSTSISLGKACLESISTPISPFTVAENSVRLRRWIGTCPMCLSEAVASMEVSR